MIREDLADVEPYRWQEGWEQRIPPGTPVIRLDQNTQPRPPAWYAGSAAWLACSSHWGLMTPSPLGLR